MNNSSRSCSTTEDNNRHNDRHKLYLAATPQKAALPPRLSWEPGWHTVLVAAFPVPLAARRAQGCLCTNLAWGWDELCNACRLVAVSAGWQHFILHDFIAEANEKFKKEDEKEERGGDKRKKKTTSQQKSQHFFQSPLALSFLRCVCWCLHLP